MAKKSKSKEPSSPELGLGVSMDFEALLEKQFADTFAEGVMLYEPSQLPDGDEITWVKAQGWTPLEMLVHAYKNPWNPIQHRVSAAKAVLDYIHKKLPQKIEVQGQVDRRITTDKLSRLSDSELEVFTKLLAKLEG